MLKRKWEKRLQRRSLSKFNAKQRFKRKSKQNFRWRKLRWKCRHRSKLSNRVSMSLRSLCKSVKTNWVNFKAKLTIKRCYRAKWQFEIGPHFPQIETSTRQSSLINSRAQTMLSKKKAETIWHPLLRVSSPKTKRASLRVMPEYQSCKTLEILKLKCSIDHQSMEAPRWSHPLFQWSRCSRNLTILPLTTNKITKKLW